MSDAAVNHDGGGHPVPRAEDPARPKTQLGKPPSPPQPLLAPAFVWSAPAAGRQSPLVIAAGPVLELCAAMKSGARSGAVEQIHREAFRAIRQFEDRAIPLGLASKMLKASKYALCATLDDVAMNSAWGSRSVWTSRSLVGAHFSETWGGDRFFDLLEQVRRDPRGNIELLELLYCCLSLGFEGRFRVSSRGASEFQLLREDVWRLIRSVRGQAEVDLSARWRGVVAPSDPGGFRFPLWGTALVALGLLLALLVLLLILIGGHMRGLTDRAAALPPQGPVTIERDAPVVMLSADRLRGFLEPEIREGLVTVTEDDRAITVTIRGDGMFASAKAEPLPQFLPLLQRIGRALEGEVGQVVIQGHTDSQAIRSAEFPSNDALSLGRAKAVRDLIVTQMSDPGRLQVDGSGAERPVADNATPEGRALNRRTEVILMKKLD